MTITTMTETAARQDYRDPAYLPTLCVIDQTPVGIMPAQSAIRRIVCGSSVSLADYPLTMRSAGGLTVAVPSVIRHVGVCSELDLDRVFSLDGPARRWLVYGSTERMCVYCDESAADTIDHVVPVVRGGTSEWKNIVPSCRDCNEFKADRSLADLGWPEPDRTAYLEVANLIAMHEALMIHETETTDDCREVV